MTISVIAVVCDGKLHQFSHGIVSKKEEIMYYTLHDLGNKNIIRPEDLGSDYETYFLERGEIDEYKIMQINMTAKTI